MTDRKTLQDKQADKAASRGGNRTTEEISRQLQTYYDSLVDEGVPDTFLDLLEKLDRADKARSGGSGA